MTAKANFYNVELRDKAGYLKGYLTPWAKTVSWEWNRIGGCGGCRITLGKAYRDIEFNAGDDIQIRIPYAKDALLINGSMEGWGAGPSAAPDGWYSFGLGATIAQEASIVKSGTYSAKFTRVGTDSAFYQRFYEAKGLSYWVGKKVIFGCWVYATIANRAMVQITDGVQYIQSAYHTGDSTWQWLTATIIVDAGVTDLYAACYVMSGDTSAYFDGATCIEIKEAKLAYRGWVAGVTPSLKIPQEITLDVRGYFDKLDFLIVQANSIKKTYSNQLVSAIVTNIIDTFVTPNSSITKGTIDGASFNVDTIQFKTTVADALQTLADLEGKIEYGVDENLVFFWRTQSETMSHKFIIGINVDLFERRIDWSKLLNRIYFEGGDVGGSPYAMMVEATDSQARYFLAEGIKNNSSIITASVATQYLNAILSDRARSQLALRAQIKNTNIRIEDTVPLGKIGIYDKDYDQSLYKWGTIANGGSNLIWGRRATGGSNGIWGGIFKDQIDRIAYTLSETEDRFNIEITTGVSVTEATAKINQIDNLLESVRQNQ